MKLRLLAILSVVLLILAACGSGNGDEAEDTEHDDHGDAADGLTPLIVEFEVPETAEVGEAVKLKAIVSFDGEPVPDAEQMDFEYWERGDRDNSITVEADDHGDGTYTTEVTFEQDGIYEMFAHTTAKDQHVMPLETITVGDVSDIEYDEEDAMDEHDHHDHDHDDEDHEDHRQDDEE